ncbi:MAG: hypothetical protein CMG75_10490 [Candidatus Marinimicrobia bacterium]|nr:hypothetical protein [Candidatus Neomarinimicrobiota bacterium]
MKFHLYIYIFCFLIILGCVEKNKNPSDFHIYGELDTADVSIGDIISFEIWAKGIGSRKIEFPPLIIDDDNIIITERNNLANEFKDDIGIEFQLTFWDTGNFEIPPYSFPVLNEAGKELIYSIQPDPSQVRVHSLLSESQMTLRDLKPPVPIPLMVPWKTILSVLGIIFSFLGLLWIWRKRIHDQPKKLDIQIPNRLPYEIAMDKLEILKNENPSDSETFKKYYEELSYLVREYIENQYFLRAMEMTTTEIEKTKFYFPISDEKLDKIILILKRADLTKFAKFVPSISSYNEDLLVVDEFLKLTRLSWITKNNGVKPMEVV